MTRLRIARRPSLWGTPITATARRMAWGCFAAAAMVSISPSPAGAQFGALRKLKEGITGSDSATRVKDSLAKLQATANGSIAAADTAEGQSRFARARSAAARASNKFEQVTGVSTKDAALALSGAGITNIAAKKLGVDPVSLAGNAMNKMNQKAAQSSGGGKLGAIMSGGMSRPSATHRSGTPDAPDASAMQAMVLMQQQQALMAMKGIKGKGAVAPHGASEEMLGMPDAQLMIAFQQEMMQVAMAATAGDKNARKKLDAWTELEQKFEAESAPLGVAAGGGDMAAFAKVTALQTKYMRQWMNTYGGKTTIKP